MVRKRLIGYADRPLIAVVVALCLLGLYNLASAGQAIGASLQTTQAMHMALGAVLLIAVASVDYRNFEGLAIPVFIVVVGLLVATMVFGKTINGSKRWLPTPLFNMQTSDLAKLAVVLIVARLLHLEGREGQGLTLSQIFRPMNASRPLILVVGVAVLSLAGDSIKPPALKQAVGAKRRLVAKLLPDRGAVAIGRSEAANVRLRYRDIDARHAQLTRADHGAWLLTDLGSDAGTYLNGARVTEPTEIRHGDVLRLGLSPRAELHVDAPFERLKPFLPWLAVLGAFYLFAALFSQLSTGRFSARDLIAPIDVVAIPCLLIMVQPDLGTTLVVLAIAFTIILYVGLQPLSLLLLALFSVASVVVAWLALLKPYQKQRVLTFLNPSSDLLGAGYHQHQSLIAIGSGELMGKGHAQGTQTQLSFLPEQQTDFIFSVWAEEHGFIGCAIVVLLFAALILLSFRIAIVAKDRFGALLVVGVTAMLFWHTLINMLMVLRLAPVVGVPLPLWSYGGSFIVTTMIGLGIVLNVGMRRYVF